MCNFYVSVFELQNWGQFSSETTGATVANVTPFCGKFNVFSNAASSVSIC